MSMAMDYVMVSVDEGRIGIDAPVKSVTAVSFGENLTG